MAADHQTNGTEVATDAGKKANGPLQSMSEGIMNVAQSGNGSSSGWQTAIITAISALGSIVSLIAKNTTSSSAKSALLTAGGIVGLLTNIGGSASGLLTPQEEHTATQYYARFQKILGGPLTTFLLTLLGVAGSALTLVAADTSLSPKTTKRLLVAGAIIAIVFNLASSLGAHITPNPTPAAKAAADKAAADKAAADKAAADAEAAVSKVVIHMPTPNDATAADLDAAVHRLFQAALDAHKAKAASPGPPAVTQ